MPRSPKPTAPPGEDRTRLAVHDLLSGGLSELGLAPDPAAVERLTELAMLLDRWRRRLNLTGHQGALKIAQRLILDAAALLQELPPFERLADLGSGAGFPGLPVAILAPERSVVLVEARERRHHFQRAAIRALQAHNVESLWGRAEHVEPRPCDLVVAQAMAPVDQVLSWMLRWAEPGAVLAIPGGEVAPAPKTGPELDVLEARVYRVPAGGPSRTLWLGRVRPASG